jgi:uncharacterized protein
MSPVKKTHPHTHFEIRSSEGLPIRAVLEVPAGAEALVVTVHGFKGFKDWGFFPWTSESFADAGIATCRFDFSRNGIGDEGSDSFERLDLFADDTYSQQVRDLQSVCAHLNTLEEVKRLPRFLFGHSRGGAIAILGARRIPGVRGVITWNSISRTGRWDDAAIARWRASGFMDFENARTKQLMRLSTRVLDDLEANRAELDVEAALNELVLPMLVVHGGSDESVPVEEATVISSATRNASLVVIENGTHTFGAIHPMIHVPKELRLAMVVTRKFVHTWTHSRRAHVE